MSPHVEDCPVALVVDDDEAAWVEAALVLIVAIVAAPF
jgi:hypothetical protein